MAKQASKKPDSKKSGRNNDRNNGKAWKLYKRSGREGATGRTVGGYSKEALARRAAKRAHVA